MKQHEEYFLEDLEDIEEPSDEALQVAEEWYEDSGIEGELEEGDIIL